MTGARLSVRDLSVTYRDRSGSHAALRGVSLDVPAGRLTALVGPSGSGKSTLVAAVTGLLPDTARSTGEIWLDDAPVHALRPAAMRRLRGRTVAVVPQEQALSLNPVLPVGAQVAEVLIVHGLAGRREARLRAVPLLRAAGLADAEDVAGRYPHELSGGMRQRVLLAIALAAGPRLVLADEPASALDRALRDHVLGRLTELVATTGATVVLVTHDLAVVDERAGHVVVLQDGRVTGAGARPRTAADVGNPTGPASPGTAAGTTDRGEDAEALLRTERLTKTFRRGRLLVPAVADVSLALHRHESLAVVGASGAGKSTLAALLLRLVAPTSGRVVFDGVDVATLTGPPLRDFRRRVQLVFQDARASLDPQLTVTEIVAEPLRSFGVPRREARGEARRVADQVELPGRLLTRRPRDLSGGECQRVALARALVPGPRVLVLDEPTSALDQVSRARLLRLLQDLRQEHEVSYLVVSHDERVVEALADRVIHLHEGRSQGPPLPLPLPLPLTGDRSVPDRPRDTPSERLS